MRSLNKYITEAFREVSSGQVIDLGCIGTEDKHNISVPNFPYMLPLSDFFNGPTEYYADDETLDFFERYFEKNPDYKFIVPGLDENGTDIDFYVKTKREKLSFKILLTSDEVRAEDHACIIPYKEDGKLKILENEKLDYLIWKVPNRNDYYLISRRGLLDYLGTVDNLNSLVRIQKVRDKKDVTVIRISKSTLNMMSYNTKIGAVTKGTFRNKDVLIGKDFEEHQEKLRQELLKRGAH